MACLQTAGTPGDLHANLAELDRAAQRAAEAGAGLLVTPELFLTGYDIGELAGELARRNPVEPCAGIAARHGIALVVGTPLLRDGNLVNAAVFLGADGAVRAEHHKIQLFGDLDRSRFTPGDRAVTAVDHEGVRIALLICYDVEFPEWARRAALDGAQLIVVPTAQMTPFARVAEQVVPVRAWENQVYVCYADRIGRERDTTYVGRSSVVAPDGTRIAHAVEEPALLLADIDPDRVRRAQRDNPYLTDLRTDLPTGRDR
ncbi:carbon-nitrogen hydrolase family protein [Saccharopolyspora sp. HNM0983]|uniref:Carbon-nitrogen hydrolase family protein n=1 Tax=Saccharopolyspora montiporae TaxID=2781240 RepID=A0A929G0A1_9PSEU|nr:carbon-nitrogen hydrolase family protein [Saccharopolyspora sp. HNM0983]MBE9374602.1 carbon-nitrogen hydrolase family protein [Saccharopolyspora sp. HNM0983]